MNGQRLRPLGLGDIFDEGFDLYKRNFVFLLLVTAVAVVPLDILLAWINPRLLPPIFDQFSLTRTDQFWKGIVTGLVELTLYLPLYALAVAPLVAAVCARYLETEVTLGDVYRQVFRRLPGLLLTALLCGLMLTLGLVGCLVAWLPVAGQILFTLHTFLVERKAPGKALGRSRALVSGYGGRVFTCLCQLGLIAWLIGLGLKLPLAYLFDAVLNITPAADTLYGSGVPGAGQSAQQEVVSLLSSGMAHLLVLPFLVSVVTVLYFDMRIRKEGFDVELMAQELNYPPLAALGAHLPPAPTFGPIRPGYAPPQQYPGYRGGPR